MNKIVQIKANGFVASIIFKEILEQGYRVMSIILNFLAKHITKESQNEDDLKTDKQEKNSISVKDNEASMIGELASIQNYYERFVIRY